MMMRSLAIGLGLACASSAATAAGELPFHCSVKNAAMLKGRITAQQVCDEMKAGAERQLRVKMTSMPVFGQADRARRSWVKIDVTFQASGEAVAQVSRKNAGRVRDYPPIAVSVSDKRMDSQSIKQLAYEVGNALSH